MSHPDGIDLSGRWLEAVDFGQQLAEAERDHAREVRRTLLSFLDVLDSFDRFVNAVQGKGEAPTPPGWLSTALAVRRQLERALEGAGIEFMSCGGEPFDPERHQALAEEQAPGQEPGIVLREEVRGCEWKGQVLRLAQVVVAGRGDTVELG